LKATQVVDGETRVLTYLRPNMYFGEIGLVSRELIDVELPPDRWDRRAATCSALDHVEVVRVRRDDFRTMLADVPAAAQDVRRRGAPAARRRPRVDRRAGRAAGQLPRSGFLQREKMLVFRPRGLHALRPVRPGLRRRPRRRVAPPRCGGGAVPGRFLVASACRSCTDPYCLVGCPVDAIHREGSLETVIEDHCIGCGQCAKNCPYHNIRMIDAGDA